MNELEKRAAQEATDAEETRKLQNMPAWEFIDLLDQTMRRRAIAGISWGAILGGIIGLCVDSQAQSGPNGTIAFIAGGVTGGGFAGLIAGLGFGVERCEELEEKMETIRKHRERQGMSPRIRKYFGDDIEI
jgi:uncharacterized protein YcfJ